jgi:putative transposase
MIKYKCQLNNINVIITEESYTSKTSFIDNEPVKFHETYKGNRKHRGLFISEKGIKINANKKIIGVYFLMIKKSTVV